MKIVVAVVAVAGIERRRATETFLHDKMFSTVMNYKKQIEDLI
jgi:hypothetical protein